MLKFNIPLLLISLLLLGSCVSYKDTLYFRDGETLPENELLSSVEEKIENLEPLKIRNNDVVVINVHTYDPLRSVPFNPASVQRGVGVQTANPFNSYLVSPEGEIEFPVLGRIHLQGLTVVEAEDKVRGLLEDYLREPTVNVRISSFRVTVLGEVNNPGVFSVTNDRVSILEALGLAKDINAYGNRKRVLLVREEAGERSYAYLNLQSRDLFQSPYYYLRQGDVIYVEPTVDKEADIRDKFTEAIPWVTSVLSAIVTVISIVNLTRQ